MPVSMEPTRFDHSRKNIIPLPSEKDYNRTLIEKTELLCKRMRWKAFFFLNSKVDGNKKETFGFNSRATPPQITEILNFEKRLLQMIANTRFREVNCSFQRQFSSDIENNIMKSTKLLVPADETANFYKIDSSSYNVLLNKNITKTYKKVNPSVANSLELEAKSLSQKLHLDDRINTTAKREAFITLKDHKPNFDNNPTCRLVNTTNYKAEIGKISKQILDTINTKVVHTLKLNQWKNTNAILNWSNSIQCRASCRSVIPFDVVDFYQSISIDFLHAALDFASQFVYISNDDRHTILLAKTSLLYSNGQLWAKKTSSNLFDITMGSYDGAELCELVGAYLLYLIKEEFRDTCDFGLYRDDGLGVSKATPRQTDLIKKKLCTIFSKNGQRITIEVNKPTVNFLDVTLHLKNGTRRPFSKPGNIPLYVNSKSNHPSRIIQNILKSINKPLS